MQIEPLNDKLVKLAARYNLTKKLAKQMALFEENPHHPSLNTEKLKPKEFGLYSFRIDRKYRAIFHVLLTGDIQIIDINNHYQ